MPSHSPNIVDVLSDLLDKAQPELDDTLHAESNAARNFSMLQQSLEDQLEQLNRAVNESEGGPGGIHDVVGCCESRSSGG